MKWKVWILESYLVPYMVAGTDDKQEAVDAAKKESGTGPCGWEFVEDEEGAETGVYVEIMEE